MGWPMGHPVYMHSMNIVGKYDLRSGPQAKKAAIHMYILHSHGKIGISFLTRAPTGGADIRPGRFFVDNGKTVTRSAAKVGMTIPPSFLHILCKF